MAEGTMPWQTSTAKGDDKENHFKYQYHPGGDMNKAPKNAPSALHSVIIPNVTLPKVGSNQWAGFRAVAGYLLILQICRAGMISITNGVKTNTTFDERQLEMRGVDHPLKLQCVQNLGFSISRSWAPFIMCVERLRQPTLSERQNALTQRRSACASGTSRQMCFVSCHALRKQDIIPAHPGVSSKGF